MCTQFSYAIQLTLNAIFSFLEFTRVKRKLLGKIKNEGNSTLCSPYIRREKFSTLLLCCCRNTQKSTLIAMQHKLPCSYSISYRQSKTSVFMLKCHLTTKLQNSEIQETQHSTSKRNKNETPNNSSLTR